MVSVHHALGISVAVCSTVFFSFVYRLHHRRSAVLTPLFAKPNDIAGAFAVEFGILVLSVPKAETKRLCVTN